VQVLKKKGEGDKLEASKIIEKWDTDKSGEVDFAEFKVP